MLESRKDFVYEKMVCPMLYKRCDDFIHHSIFYDSHFFSQNSFTNTVSEYNVQYFCLYSLSHIFIR